MSRMIRDRGDAERVLEARRNGEQVAAHLWVEALLKLPVHRVRDVLAREGGMR